MLPELTALIKKDLMIEWRQRYAVNGILLHVISSVLVVFLSVKVMDPPTWNAVFWLIMLFTSVSAVAKSFMSESRGRLLYYYSIASPRTMILSKIVLNSILMLVVSAVCLVVYIVMLGNAIGNLPYYIFAMILGSLGFSGTFTMLSSIASKAGNGNLLMPVLSFPVIIPLLLVLIRASKKAMDAVDVSLIWPDLLVLGFINVIVVLLATLLFPYLWKD